MKCTLPVCIYYHESIDNPNNPKTYCDLHGFEINYTNIDKIENCENHKTFQKLKENWKNMS
ncbi:MAG: hypothetical protein LLF98_01860 [Clostridium sp.]|uniref:hypothetical protein n=1 Tax=Clostridium sp. TaxID=1506 RepID=UPI0025C689DA|nr:hypothetical protein [Clostridium sp.]MCE5220026.1 hypothetical protein [Clostridium sp.]